MINQALGLLLQLARAKLEAPRFVAGALRDEAVGGLPGPQRRDIRGEVLPAKGPARAPWPKLRLQVAVHPVCLLDGGGGLLSSLNTACKCSVPGKVAGKGAPADWVCMVGRDT